MNLNTTCGNEATASDTAHLQRDEFSECSSRTGPGAASRLALKLIRFYQRYLSPLTPPSCRFHPTCSHYTYRAIERFGLWRGGWMSLCRLCKCHPFHPGGYDPVPESLSQQSPRKTA